MLLQLGEIRSDYPISAESVSVPAQVELAGPAAAAPLLLPADESHQLFQVVAVAVFLTEQTELTR